MIFDDKKILMEIRGITDRLTILESQITYGSELFKQIRLLESRFNDTIKNFEEKIQEKTEEAKCIVISRSGKESLKEYTAYVVTLILKYLDVEYKDEACLVKRGKRR